MRKRIQLLIVGLMLALALAACGDTATPSTTTSAATTTAAATTTTAAATTTTAAATTTTAAATTAPATTTAATTTAAASTAAGTATTTAAMTAAGSATAGGTAMASSTAGGSSTPSASGSGSTQPNSGTYSALFTPDSSVKQGGDVTTYTINDGKTLAFYNTTSATDIAWIGMLYTGQLLTRDPKTSLLVCQTCQSYQVSSDYKTVTFKLRTDIKWSDGQPITADDYAWTYQQALDPNNKWPYIDDYKDLFTSMTAPDPQTVVVTLTNPLFNTLETAGTTFEPLPKHVWDGKSFTDTTKNPNMDSPTVVSGPWLLKEWKRGDHITFARNPNSTVWPAPYLNTITVQIIKDPTVAYQKLKSGDLTFASGASGGIGAGLQPSDFADFTKSKPSGFTSQTWYPTASTWNYIGFNFRKPYLKDLAMRQALNYAVDKQGIIDNFAYGLAQPTYSDVPPSDKAFYTTNGVNQYAYSLDKAKSTLTAAGYTGVGSGLKDKSGTAVPKLKILYNTGNSVRQNIAVYFQSQLQELGIQADVVPLDFNAYLKQISSDPFDYDFFVLGWQSSFDDQTFGDVWKAIPDLNSGNYVNDQVNSLYAKVRTTLDPAAQVPLMQQIQQIESNDPPYIYLYVSEQTGAYSDKLTPSKANNLGDNYFEYIDWHLNS
jgi:peptide/nickel transport system substrate-binding protein